MMIDVLHVKAIGCVTVVWKFDLKNANDGITGYAQKKTDVRKR